MGADMSAVRALILTTTLALGLTACGDDGTAAARDDLPPVPPPALSEVVGQASAPAADPAAEQSSDDAAGKPKVAGTIATGFDAPWGLAILPDGSALVSERDSGRIKRVAKDGAVSTVGTVPGVVEGGEGGLLGIAVAENFADTPLLYAYFTAATDNRIVRMDYSANNLGKPEVLVSGINKAGVHNGGRLAFGPDGMLYAGTGDAGIRDASQNQKSLNGKILRMTPAGKPAPDNPDPASLVFTSGHRNVQGLAFDADGRLWAAEFGQNSFDELNLIRPAKNYGWPQVEGMGKDAKFTNPERVWSTDEASPSGIAVAGKSVWMAALRGTRLWEIPLTEKGAKEQTSTPKAWFEGEFGRLRTVVTAPDGSLWLITSNTDGRGDVRKGDDRILRISI